MAERDIAGGEIGPAEGPSESPVSSVVGDEAFKEGLQETQQELEHFKVRIRRAKKIPRKDVIEALRLARADAEAFGDAHIISRAARILGKTPEQVKSRIKKDRELRAYYCKLRPKMPATPTKNSTMIREPGKRAGEEMKGAAADPETVELVDVISSAERELHMKGLEAAGFSQDQLKRLRDLDKLASNTGSFLAISLEKLSRNYYFQIINLMTLSDVTYKRLTAKQGEDGFIADEEARVATSRAYLDMVKEQGNAFKLMFKGAEGLVEMLRKGNAGKPPGGNDAKRRKPGWEIKDAQPAKEPMP